MAEQVCENCKRLLKENYDLLMETVDQADKLDELKKEVKALGYALFNWNDTYELADRINPEAVPDFLK